MKHLLFFIIAGIIFTGCSDPNSDPRCNFLFDTKVAYELNMNLPQYNDLNFISNSVYIPNIGNGGVIVTNSGTGFLAWDAADPNHNFSQCSILSIEGLEASCSCPDENKYSLITGQSLETQLNCTLKTYRADQIGSNLIITSF
ncbi:MAG TPA: hypothetical protein QGI27_06065 [Flavobacteriaceae bacterium]|nr:hypothetical protein [Flavobacteriaceae bacterium]